MGQESNGTYIIGDGLYEVIKDYSYYGKLSDGGYNWIKKDGEPDSAASWGLGYYNGDFTLIGNCARAFLYRGGLWNDVTHTGLFASFDSSGYASYGDGFRPVMVL